MSQNKTATLTLIAFLIAIPAIAYFSSLGVQKHFTKEIITELSQVDSFKNQDLSGLTGGKFCSVVFDDPQTSGALATDPGIKNWCDDEHNLSLMQTAAIAAVAVGFGLMAIIAIAGRLARRRRKLLFITFAPLLHLTMLTLAGLMIVNAGLGMATLWYGESALIGSVHTGIMLALGLGAAVGVLSLLRAQFGVVKKTTAIVIGSRLEPSKYTSLKAFVDTLATSMGAAAPDTIVAGLEPNFYVTEADVRCYDGTFKGRTMYISLPLCRILTIAEFKAILGHELAHYKGKDTYYTRKFFPIYRGANEGLARITANVGTGNDGHAGNLVLVPAMLILAYFLGSFSKAESEIGRQREFAADKEAANITAPHTIASALVKAHAFSGGWRAIKNHMIATLGQGKQLINASTLFASLTSDIAAPDVLASLNEEGPPHPTDSHPPLSQRLSALNVSLGDVHDAALAVSPENSAITLIDNPSELEQNLTDLEQALMVQRGEASIPQVQDSSLGATESSAIPPQTSPSI